MAFEIPATVVVKESPADMSNVIEVAIDIDFLEVLTLTIDIEFTILE